MPAPRERITIEGFGGIKHLDLAVSPFTVLIGPQSVGKSIVAKLIFFFRSTFQYLFLSTLVDKPPRPKEVLLNQFAKIFPPPTAGGGPLKIEYFLGDNSIKLSRGGLESSDWRLDLPSGTSSLHKKLVSELKREESEDDFESRELAYESYYKRVEQIWPGASTPPRFVPAGRAFYSQIEKDAASYYESLCSYEYFTDSLRKCHP